jgi:hypothetical protein
MSERIPTVRNFVEDSVSGAKRKIEKFKINIGSSFPIWRPILLQLPIVLELSYIHLLHIGYALKPN